MRINLKEHLIEYYWQDGIDRPLNNSAIEVLEDAIMAGYVKGIIDDGESHLFDWEDITDDNNFFFWSLGRRM
jgi:hypothetical protein